MGDYSKVPTDKLEKIHYTTLKVVEKREKEGRLDGIQIKITNPAQFVYDLKAILDGIFVGADQAAEQDKDKDLLGLHYYVGVINKLPIDKVRFVVIAQEQELKKRREIRRQKLDAGNIDKIINEVAK